MPDYIQAGKFKARCLKVMDEVRKTRRRVIITKRNVPVVEISPIAAESMPLWGCLKGSIHIKGDIIHPIDEEWDANN